MSFISVVSNVRVIPNEVCIKQHHMVVSDFTTHISCVKKHKVSPQIQKLRDPVTVSQFQSAFKYSLVKAEGSIAGCCHQSLWSLQEPSIEILNLVVEWLDRRSYKNMQGSKPIVSWRREAWQRRLRGQNPPTWMTSAWQSMPSGWQSLRQRKRNLPQYPQMVMVSSVSPNRWTTQTRMLLVRTVYAIMLLSLHSLMNARWIHGNARLLEFESPSNHLPEVPPTAGLPVCPQPWSTKYSAKWNVTRLLAHLAS